MEGFLNESLKGFVTEDFLEEFLKKKSEISFDKFLKNSFLNESLEKVLKKPMKNFLMEYMENFLIESSDQLQTKFLESFLYASLKKFPKETLTRLFYGIHGQTYEEISESFQ